MDQSDSANNIIRHHKVELIKILPLEQEIFLAKLERVSLLPEGSGASIRAKSTRADRVSYFLQHVVEPAPHIYLDLLIGVMERSDDLAVNKLAGDMKRHFKSGIKSMFYGTYSAKLNIVKWIIFVSFNVF